MLEAAIKFGARPAEPGEFTQRAFMNGRVDLTEAEAVRDTIEADTDAQLRLANQIRDGALWRELSDLSESLQSALAQIEASVDFSEEVGEIDSQATLDGLQTTKSRILDLANTANTGRIIRDGLRLAIVGPPNAGKSSLLNLILGSDRAIVDASPGTTRDYIEEKADVLGFPVTLIDTAGIRQSTDPVEEVGVQRTLAIAANADLIWYVVDATQVPHDVPEFDRPVVLVANKVDLSDAPAGWLGISCLTGAGIQELFQSLVPYFEMPLGISIQTRHQPDLLEAASELELAIEALQHGRPPDLAAQGIRAALHAIGRITGDTADADIIERIFRDFCIGK
jgi:tRNA modification GTPase